MIDGDTMLAIMNDVRGMVPVASSKLKYDEEMLDFRAEVETEFAEFLKKNPKGELHVPTEVPS